MTPPSMDNMTTVAVGTFILKAISLSYMTDMLLYLLCRHNITGNKLHIFVIYTLQKKQTQASTQLAVVKMVSPKNVSEIVRMQNSEA